MKYIADKNIPLLEALALAAPDCSKTTLRSWMKLGRILVDGEVVKIGTTIVEPGQTVTLAAREWEEEKGLKIIYEDRDIVAVEKPPGLLSVSTSFEQGDTAHGILKRKYKPRRVAVVHRLDQDTSGVMVFALSEMALSKLKEIFKKHEIKRKYVAIVEGHLEEKEGTWQAYLVEGDNYTVHQTSDTTKGVLAITHYKVLGESKHHSWLDITLETGKKNQIRVHCQLAGAPVAGDKKYGAKGNPLKRLGLHAYFLSFVHPVSGKLVKFESPIPKSFFRMVKPHFSHDLE
jgi:tRNA pseudouridine32 synthase/23S rRNA pseudouridine746 synthase/23S rRNA pseudouridine1911/1915/1917 synthase